MDEGPIRVAVVGGTGTVGRLVVEELTHRGHAVRILSRRPPATRTASHHRVDLTSGEGLPEALANVRTVVEASDARPPGMRRVRRVLLDGTRHLLNAETEAGVEHHVLISIVGIDDVPFAYYRAKASQEQAVIGGRVPWTIVRATQFHSLLDELFRSFARFGVLPRSAIPLQPIDPDEAARALADSVEEGPRGGRREIAGPEISTVTELVHTWMRANARSRWLIPPPIFAGTRRELSRGALTAPDAERVGPTFDRWLRGDHGR